MVRALWRARFGVDVLAVLALVTTVAVGEYLAGAIVALMVATGELLEARARRRAHKDLSALTRRRPERARLRAGNELRTVDSDQVRPGDTVVVATGEVVPVDGTLLGTAVFDESALTGEAVPVTRQAGDRVRSGVVNAGAAADLRADATAADSTYAGVVTLARQAAADTAPIARLADRIAIWFVPLALTIAGVAWVVAGQPGPAVAVLVTATPCPLLLAVPIAVTSGMSRLSRRGVVVKGGAALETLGHARTLVLDKTGTLTEGRPEVADVVCAPGVLVTEVLAAAAAVEQYSSHVLAGAVLRAAASPGFAESVVDTPGEGVTGTVGGRRVRVGKLPQDRAVPAWARAAARRGRLDLATVVWVTIDDEVAAALLVRDRLRSDAPRALRRLRAAGMSRVVLLTGDRVDNAGEVAAMLGLDDVQARADPAGKVDRVRAEHERAVTVMVGDGVNDAPALAAADIGVALGSRGSTAAVQAADAVIVDDRIDRLADGVETARYTRRVAAQSAVLGTGLSVVAMLLAAAGWLAPVAGAIAQEAIDVAAILNALRVLRGRRAGSADVDRLLDRFAGEHNELLTTRLAVRQAADALSGIGTADTDASVRTAYRMLVERLLPHENAEETQLYPALADAVGGPEGTATMSRSHVEIARLVRRLGRHLAESPSGLRPDQADDLRATLYGLDAILTLHFAQEEEAYFTLGSDRREA
ncbi:heavy metal translocating P-type ATPase [Amycolatopsis suaedae]|uniref:Cadmium-translocating P-type ATPase n=1 Tax=Amycolatopsis suaedae TaxID=2510978 RepID=A0A4Q7JFS8_9PSEU|nr:heavy metal translocating P-type ATPase [Amycolatopsis suaedae]RZQ66136.1 cadmium-translocating P-type ATPase [Amycolatopsis suaedae]